MIVTFSGSLMVFEGCDVLFPLCNEFFHFVPFQSSKFVFLFSWHHFEWSITNLLVSLVYNITCVELLHLPGWNIDPNTSIIEYQIDMVFNIIITYKTSYSSQQNIYFFNMSSQFIPGYKPDMKYKSLIILLYFWLHTKKQNVEIWRFFSFTYDYWKIPTWSLHFGMFSF